MSFFKKELMLVLACLQFFSCAHEKTRMTMSLPKNPSYVVMNDEQQSMARRKVLLTEAEALSFPLSEEDMAMLKILEEKFDREENCAGLAAPQIGFSKQIIVFAAKADPTIKKWRPDFSQSMPKTIWINPSYEAAGDEQHADYEACFSVNDMAGMVPRYTKIHYSAYLPDGTKVSGLAEGFLARIIQHEIDHLKGILFTSHVKEDELFNLTEYRRMRREKMEK